MHGEQSLHPFLETAAATQKKAIRTCILSKFVHAFADEYKIVQKHATKLIGPAQFKSPNPQATTQRQLTNRLMLNATPYPQNF